MRRSIDHECEFDHHGLYEPVLTVPWIISYPSKMLGHSLVALAQSGEQMVVVTRDGQTWQGRPESNQPISYEEKRWAKPINEPTQQIIDWLTDFGSALEQGDFAAAAGLFAAESYWRDLVAFTWNIKTAEGQADIEAMLTATAAQTAPGGWRIEGEATSNGELTEAWFTFETAVARGKGHLRLKAGLCRTLMTTMQELKGFEEKKRPKNE